MKFIVQFKNWYNNWSEMDQEEFYASLEEAKARADQFHSFECEYIGNNNYVNNGVECWVEDSTGKVIYKPTM